MATNIEEIFRSFVVNKFKEIQEEKLNSENSESSHNGELTAEGAENTPEGSSVCTQSEGSNQTVQKAEEMQPVTLELVKPQNLAPAEDITSKELKTAEESSSDEVKKDTSKKKSKKHKKHKSKKKKKKKKKEKNEKRSKSTSSVEDQENVNSESKSIWKPAFSTPPNMPDKLDALSSKTESTNIDALPLVSVQDVNLDSMKEDQPARLQVDVDLGFFGPKCPNEMNCSVSSNSPAIYEAEMPAPLEESALDAQQHSETARYNEQGSKKESANYDTEKSQQIEIPLSQQPCSLLLQEKTGEVSGSTLTPQIKKDFLDQSDNTSALLRRSRSKSNSDKQPKSAAKSRSRSISLQRQHRSRSKSLTNVPKRHQISSKSSITRQRSRSSSLGQRRRSRSSSVGQRQGSNSKSPVRRRRSRSSASVRYSKSPIRSWWSKSIKNRQRSVSIERHGSKTRSPARRPRSRSTERRHRSRARSTVKRIRSMSRSTNRRQKSRSTSRKPRLRSKSTSRMRRSTSAKRRQSRSGSAGWRRRSRSGSTGWRRRSRSGSTGWRRRSRSGSAARRRWSRSGSAVGRRRSRSGSAVRRRRSRSGSAVRRRRSRSVSLAKRRRSRSISGVRRRRSRSGSATRRRRSRSGSAARRRRSGSGSAARRRRSRSGSAARRRRSRSGSAARRRRSRSGSAARRRKSRSGSPASRRRSRSDSYGRRRRSRSGSDGRRRSLKSGLGAKRRKSRSSSTAKRGRSRSTSTSRRRRSRSNSAENKHRSRSCSSARERRSRCGSAGRKGLSQSTATAENMSRSASGRRSRSNVGKQKSRSRSGSIVVKQKSKTRSVERKPRSGSRASTEFRRSRSKSLNKKQLSISSLAGNQTISSSSKKISNDDVKSPIITSSHSKTVTSPNQEQIKSPVKVKEPCNENVTVMETVSFSADVFDCTLKTPFPEQDVTCPYSKSPVQNLSCYMPSVKEPQTSAKPSIECCVDEQTYFTSSQTDCTELPAASINLSNTTKESSGSEILNDPPFQHLKGMSPDITEERLCNPVDEPELKTLGKNAAHGSSNIDSEKKIMYKQSDALPNFDIGTIQKPENAKLGVISEPHTNKFAVQLNAPMQLESSDATKPSKSEVYDGKCMLVSVQDSDPINPSSDNKHSKDDKLKHANQSSITAGNTNVKAHENSFYLKSDSKPYSPVTTVIASNIEMSSHHSMPKCIEKDADLVSSMQLFESNKCPKQDFNKNDYEVHEILSRSRKGSVSSAPTEHPSTPAEQGISYLPGDQTENQMEPFQYTSTASHVHSEATIKPPLSPVVPYKGLDSLFIKKAKSQIPTVFANESLHSPVLGSPRTVHSDCTQLIEQGFSNSASQLEYHSNRFLTQGDATFSNFNSSSMNADVMQEKCSENSQISNETLYLDVDSTLRDCVPDPRSLSTGSGSEGEFFKSNDLQCRPEFKRVENTQSLSNLSEQNSNQEICVSNEQTEQSNTSHYVTEIYPVDKSVQKGLVSHDYIDLGAGNSNTIDTSDFSDKSEKNSEISIELEFAGGNANLLVLGKSKDTNEPEILHFTDKKSFEVRSLELKQDRSPTLIAQQEEQNTLSSMECSETLSSGYNSLHKESVSVHFPSLSAAEQRQISQSHEGEELHVNVSPIEFNRKVASVEEKSASECASQYSKIPPHISYDEFPTSKTQTNSLLESNTSHDSKFCKSFTAGTSSCEPIVSSSIKPDESYYSSSEKNLGCMFAIPDTHAVSSLIDSKEEMDIQNQRHEVVENNNEDSYPNNGSKGLTQPLMFDSIYDKHTINKTDESAYGSAREELSSAERAPSTDILVISEHEKEDLRSVTGQGSLAVMPGGKTCSDSPVIFKLDDVTVEKRQLVIQKSEELTHPITEETVSEVTVIHEECSSLGNNVNLDSSVVCKDIMVQQSHSSKKPVKEPILVAASNDGLHYKSDKSKFSTIPVFITAKTANVESRFDETATQSHSNVSHDYKPASISTAPEPKSYTGIPYKDHIQLDVLKTDRSGQEKIKPHSSITGHSRYTKQKESSQLSFTSVTRKETLLPKRETKVNLEVDNSKTHTLSALKSNANTYEQSEKVAHISHSESKHGSSKEYKTHEEQRLYSKTTIHELKSCATLVPLHFKFSKTFKTLPISHLCNTPEDTSAIEPSKVSTLSSSEPLCPTTVSSDASESSSKTFPDLPSAQTSVESSASCSLENTKASQDVSYEPSQSESQSEQLAGKDLLQPDSLQGPDDSQSGATTKHTFPHLSNALSKLGVKQRQYRSRSVAQESRSPSVDRGLASRSRSKSATRRRRSRSKSVPRKKRSQSSTRKKSSHSKSARKRHSRSRSGGRKRRSQSKSKGKKKHSPSKSGKRKRSSSKSSERTRSSKCVGKQRCSRSKSKTRRNRLQSKSPGRKGRSRSKSGARKSSHSKTSSIRKTSHSKSPTWRRQSHSRSLSSRSRSRSMSASWKRLSHSKASLHRKHSRSSSKSTSPRRRSRSRNKDRSLSRSPGPRHRSRSRSHTRWHRSRSRGRWCRSRSLSTSRRQRSRSSSRLSRSLSTKKRKSLSKSPVRKRRSRSQAKQKDKSPVSKRKSTSPLPPKKLVQSKSSVFKHSIGLKSLIQKQLSQAKSKGSGGKLSIKEQIPLSTVPARTSLSSFSTRAQVPVSNLTIVGQMPMPNLADVPLPNVAAAGQVPLPNVPPVEQLSVSNLAAETQLSVPDLTTATQWHVPDMSSGAQWPVPDIAAGTQWSVTDLGTGTQWPMSDLTTGSHWPMHDLTVGPQWSVPDLAAGTQWAVPDVASGAQWAVPDLTAGTHWTVPDLTAGPQWTMTNLTAGTQWAVPDLAATTQWTVPDLTSGAQLHRADMAPEAQVPGSDLALEAQVPGSDLATEAQVPGSDLAAEAQVPGSDLATEAQVPPEHELAPEALNLMPDVAAEALVPVASGTLVPDVAAGISLPDVAIAAQIPVPDVAAVTHMPVPDVATTTQKLISHFAPAQTYRSVHESIFDNNASKPSVYSDLSLSPEEPVDNSNLSETIRSMEDQSEAEAFGTTAQQSTFEPQASTYHSLNSELSSSSVQLPALGCSEYPLSSELNDNTSPLDKQTLQVNHATVTEMPDNFPQVEPCVNSECHSEPCSTSELTLFDTHLSTEHPLLTEGHSISVCPISDAPHVLHEHNLIEPHASPDRPLLVEPSASPDHHLLVDPYTSPVCTLPYHSPDHNLLIEPYSKPDHPILVASYASPDRPLLTEPCAISDCPLVNDSCVSPDHSHMVETNASPVHSQLVKLNASPSILLLVEPYASPERPQLVEPYPSPEHPQLVEPYASPHHPQLVEPYASPDLPQLVEPYISPDHDRLVEPYASPDRPQLVEPYASPDHAQICKPYLSSVLAETFCSPGEANRNSTAKHEVCSSPSHPLIYNIAATVHHPLTYNQDCHFDVALPDKPDENLNDSCPTDPNASPKLTQEPLPDSRIDFPQLGESSMTSEAAIKQEKLVTPDFPHLDKPDIDTAGPLNEEPCPGIVQAYSYESCSSPSQETFEESCGSPIKNLSKELYYSPRQSHVEDRSEGPDHLLSKEHYAKPAQFLTEQYHSPDTAELDESCSTDHPKLCHANDSPGQPQLDELGATPDQLQMVEQCVSHDQSTTPDPVHPKEDCANLNQTQPNKLCARPPPARDHHQQETTDHHQQEQYFPSPSLVHIDEHCASSAQALLIEPMHITCSHKPLSDKYCFDHPFVPDPLDKPDRPLSSPDQAMSNPDMPFPGRAASGPELSLPDTATSRPDSPLPERPVCRPDSPLPERPVCRPDSPLPERPVCRPDSPLPERPVCRPDSPLPQRPVCRPDSPLPERPVCRPDSPLPERPVCRPDSPLPERPVCRPDPPLPERPVCRPDPPLPERPVCRPDSPLPERPVCRPDSPLPERPVCRPDSPLPERPVCRPDSPLPERPVCRPDSPLPERPVCRPDSPLPERPVCRPDPPLPERPVCRPDPPLPERPVCRPDSPLPERPVCRPDSPLPERPVCRPDSPLPERPVCRPDSPLPERPVCRPDSPLPERPVCRPDSPLPERPVCRPDSPLPERPVCRPDSPLPERPVCRPDSPLPERPVCRPESPLPERPVCRPESPLPERPVCRPDSPLPERPVCRPDSPLPERPVCRPDSPLPERPVCRPDSPLPERPVCRPDSPLPERPVCRPDSPRPERPVCRPDSPLPERPVCRPDSPLMERPVCSPDSHLLDIPVSCLEQIPYERIITDHPLSDDAAASSDCNLPERLTTQDHLLLDKLYSSSDQLVLHEPLESCKYPVSEESFDSPSHSLKEHPTSNDDNSTPSEVSAKTNQTLSDGTYSNYSQVLNNPDFLISERAQTILETDGPVFNKCVGVLLSVEKTSCATDLPSFNQDKSQSFISNQVSVMSVECAKPSSEDSDEHLKIDHHYKTTPPDLLPYDSEQPTGMCSTSEPSSEPVLFISQPPPELLPYDSEQPANPFLNISDYSSEQASSVFHTPPELLPYDSDQPTVLLKQGSEPHGEELPVNELTNLLDQNVPSAMLSVTQTPALNLLSVGSFSDSLHNSNKKESDGEQFSSSDLKGHDLSPENCEPSIETPPHHLTSINEISVSLKFDTSKGDILKHPSEEQSSIPEILAEESASIPSVVDGSQELPCSGSFTGEPLCDTFMSELPAHQLLTKNGQSPEQPFLGPEFPMKSDCPISRAEEQTSLTLNISPTSEMQCCFADNELASISEPENSTVIPVTGVISVEATNKRSRSKSLSKTELPQSLIISSNTDPSSESVNRTARSHSRSADRKKSRSKSATRKKPSRSKSVTRRKKSRSKSLERKRRSRSASTSERKKSRSVSDTRKRRSHSAVRKRHSRSLSVAKKKGSRSRSVARRRGSRSTSATRRRRSRSSSMSHRKRSHSSSVGRKRSRSPSVARRRRSRSRSLSRRRHSRSPSAYRRRGSRSPSITRRRHSASVTRRRRSRSASLIRRRRSRSPSPAVTRRRRSPSPAVTRRRRSPSPAVTRRRRSPSPAVTRRRRSPSLSVTCRKRSSSPSVTRRRRSRSPSASRKRSSPSASHKKRSRSQSASRRKRSRSKSVPRKKRSPSASSKRCSRSSSAPRKRQSGSKSPTPKSPANKQHAQSKSDRSRSRSQSNIARKRKTHSRSSSRDKNKSTEKRRKRSNSKDHYSVKQRRKSRTPPRRKKSRSPGRRASVCISPVRRRRSRSPVRRKSFSRSPIRRKRSRSRDQSMDCVRSPKRLTDLDKAQLLEIAKANAAAMCAKAGVPLPLSLKPTMTPAAPAEDKITHRTYGVTIQELTEKCKQIAQSKEDDVIVNKPHDSDEEEEDRPFYNHPFKVSEHKPISFSLLNPSLKPSPKTQVTLTKEFPVSSGSQHRKKESDKVYGEWVPVAKKTEESKDDVFTNTAPSQPVDITSAMNERAVAQTRLTGNPFDLEALFMLNRAQEQIDAWAQSTSIPGQFTGSTGAQVLTADEISNSGPQAWLKKDQFLKAAPVTGGRGALLMRKMGWREGEGLGRNNEGNVDPIVLDFKTDRKGLVADGEKASNKLALPAMKDLSGKHPISVLMELCNKKKWSPPEFVLVDDTGPEHRKRFLFRVTVNGVLCQPSQPSVTKKLAKATAAAAALQALGALPKESSITSTTNFCSASTSTL